VVVLAIKDKKDFQSLEPEAYLEKGQLDLAGLFLRARDKNYALMRLDAQGAHPHATVYHEYTHHKIQFTAITYTPAGELHPCTDLEGMKAHIEFFEAVGKSAEG